MSASDRHFFLFYADVCNLENRMDEKENTGGQPSPFIRFIRYDRVENKRVILELRFDFPLLNLSFLCLLGKEKIHRILPNAAQLHFLHPDSFTRALKPRKESRFLGDMLK